MTRHVVLFKVTAFALLTVLGVSYMAGRYLGVGASLFEPQYSVAMDLPDSGGIFTDAEVTYRGVTVGRVGPISLRGDGIRVRLDLSTQERIPAQLRAVVANGSAVGEQFVDLQPTTTEGPYLEDGSVIPEADTALPTPITSLLLGLDRLVNSVPREDLQVLVEEAGLAFDGRGDDLQRLVDSTDALVREAQDALPETTRLLTDGETVLTTQVDEQSALTGFSRDLRLLSEQLKTSDPDLRAVLRDGVPAAQELRRLVDELNPTLSPLLRDLVGVGEVVDARVNSIRQLLIYYPYLVSASFTIFPGDGTTRFGVPLNQVGGPPPCREGYPHASEWRGPEAVSTPPFDPGSWCQEPKDSGSQVRGSRNAPPPSGDAPSRQRPPS
jgi:phospholipid/cholesterol/gamma-HCH transport system substrate-binding protein